MKNKDLTEITEKVVMAYLSGNGQWTAKDIDVSKLTHINYAFAKISEGKITLGNERQKLEILRELKRKKPSLKILISIGGWQADGFSDTILTEERRNIFVDSIISFVAENEFDGVDLDWEYPGLPHGGITARPEDRYNYTLMVESLREKLDELGAINGRNYLLTMAMGAGQLYVDTIEFDRVNACLDYINIMTYDFCGGYDPVTGHHTNLYPSKILPDAMSADKAVNILLQAGADAVKIVVGIAFYGRGWSDAGNAEKGLGQPAAGEGPDGGAYTYSDLKKEYINKNGFTRYWDNDAKAPYLFDGKIFISYEDEESIQNKVLYVKEKGLAGVMFWEYSQDFNGSLLNKIYECIK